MKYRLATNDDAEAIRAIYNREVTETMPWDHFDVGVKKAGLRREWERAWEAAAPAAVIG